MQQHFHFKGPTKQWAWGGNKPTWNLRPRRWHHGENVFTMRSTTFPLQVLLWPLWQFTHLKAPDHQYSCTAAHPGWVGCSLQSSCCPVGIGTHRQSASSPWTQRELQPATCNHAHSLNHKLYNAKVTNSRKRGTRLWGSNAVSDWFYMVRCPKPSCWTAARTLYNTAHKAHDF